jgi:ABC-2 type transport system ATP-binding protein
MYVREYLAFCAGLHHIPQNQQKDAIEAMIQRTGLGREAHKKIGALSKGYKQRVGLAAAMIHDPEVLILDEPTSGLDPNQLVDIRKLILDLGKSKTLLISTHNMKEVEALCSQVIILDRGVVKANEPIQHLRGSHLASQRILLVELDKSMSKKQLQDIPGVRKVKAISEQQFLLEVTGEQDHRPAVFQWAVQVGCMVLAMHYQEQDMETVFRERTQNGN